MKASKIAARVFMLVGIGMFLLLWIHDNKLSEKMSESSNMNFQNKISGTISSITENRGTTKVWLNKGEVFYFGITRNYKLNPSDFNEFVRGGDSVYKAPNSNELFVFRAGQKYRFVLEELVND